MLQFIPKEKIEWDNLIDSIHEGSCILILGPELALRSKGFKDHGEFIAYIQQQAKDFITTYHDYDGFFLLEDVKYRSVVERKLKKFFELTEFQDPDLLYQKLIQLKFPLYLALCPDTFLRTSFQEYEVPANFAHYQKNKPQTEAYPTQDMPLVYNLFGDISDAESLILTHNDLFEFVTSILKDRSLSDNIRNFVNEADSLIFLGVPFQHWYVQLILRILGLHEDTKWPIYSTTSHFPEAEGFTHVSILENPSEEPPLSRTALDDHSEVSLTVCHKQFQVEFVEANVKEFIDRLFDSYQVKYPLRALNQEPKDSPNKKLKTLIAKDRLREAIEFLEDFTESNDLEILDTVTKLSGRLSRLERRSASGVLAEDQKDVKWNQFREDLLNIVNQI